MTRLWEQKQREQRHLQDRKEWAGGAPHQRYIQRLAGQRCEARLQEETLLTLTRRRKDHDSDLGQTIPSPVHSRAKTQPVKKRAIIFPPILLGRRDSLKEQEGKAEFPTGCLQAKTDCCPPSLTHTHIRYTWLYQACCCCLISLLDLPFFFHLSLFLLTTIFLIAWQLLVFNLDQRH